jgi:hypothetical protein
MPSTAITVTLYEISNNIFAFFFLCSITAFENNHCVKASKTGGLLQEGGGRRILVNVSIGSNLRIIIINATLSKTDKRGLFVI